MANKSAWVFNSIAQIAIIIVSGYLIVEGEFSAGLLVSAVGIIGDVTGGVNNIADYLSNILSSKPIQEKIERSLQVTGVMEEEKETALGSSNTLNLPPTDENADREYAIHLENVSFSYDELEVLDRVNANFRRNSCSAIVGASGSGKSTIARLLLKSVDNYEGLIEIDGLNLAQLSERQIYEKLGFVAQETFIFQESLFDNIYLFAKEERNATGEYEKIISLVNLDSLAQREAKGNKLDPAELSGGEKQRIGIARVLAKKSEIIIMDEPTSGLDPENVDRINKIIFSLDDVTRVVITHDWRKEYLRNFDAVWELKDRDLEKATVI